MTETLRGAHWGNAALSSVLSGAHGLATASLQGAQFDIVLDSAVYHVFEPGPERDAYVANLGKLVKPGAHIHW